MAANNKKMPIFFPLFRGQSYCDGQFQIWAEYLNMQKIEGRPGRIYNVSLNNFNGYTSKSLHYCPFLKTYSVQKINCPFKNL